MFSYLQGHGRWSRSRDSNPNRFICSEDNPIHFDPSKSVIVCRAGRGHVLDDFANLRRGNRGCRRGHRKVSDYRDLLSDLRTRWCSHDLTTLAAAAGLQPAPVLPALCFRDRGTSIMRRSQICVYEMAEGAGIQPASVLPALGFQDRGISALPTFHGVPGRNLTCDLSFRKTPLYTTELRERN